MLRTAQLLPLTRAFDTALRRRAFPPDAGSLLPGPLAATRTGLAPAGNDELPTESDHVITQPPSKLQGILPGLVEVEVAVPRLRPAVW
jgi:hypothetical protein